MIGTPLMWCCSISRLAVWTVSSGVNVTGSLMTPFSDRLTLSTSRVWAATLRFLWMIPMPPSWASAMASSLSVTVSIGADRMGRLRRTWRVSEVRTSTSFGMTSEYAGSRRTSSNVMPWYAMRSCMADGSRRLDRGIQRL